MKKRAGVIIAIMLSLLFTGCENKQSESTFDKAMSEGKLAVASKEYEKAEGMFSLATQENEDDKEANALYKQTSIFLEAQKLIEDEKYDEAKAKIEELKGIDSNLDTIKKDADKLLEDIKLSSNNDKNQTDNSNTNKEQKGELVLDYVVNQSEEEMNGITYRDGDGKITLAESDYLLDQADEDNERLVSPYVPETSVIFSLKNTGNETITNPVINFHFNDMAIEFEPNDKWQGIGHVRGIGTWYEVRWSPEPGTTIQPDVPVDFTFGFQNASIYSDNASIDVTISGDNFKAKKFNIPVKLVNNF